MSNHEAQLVARTRPNWLHVGSARWNVLSFLHWQVDPQVMQSTLAPGLNVDGFNGAAYIGILPFFIFMVRVRPRWLPPARALALCANPVDVSFSL